MQLGNLTPEEEPIPLSHQPSLGDSVFFDRSTGLLSAYAGLPAMSPVGPARQFNCSQIFYLEVLDFCRANFLWVFESF